jgi:hypothetical protein
MSDDVIRKALEVAAREVLLNLGDRRGIGDELDNCDEDIQQEIGQTVAAAAIGAFLREMNVIAFGYALPDSSTVFRNGMHVGEELAAAIARASGGGA